MFQINKNKESLFVEDEKIRIKNHGCFRSSDEKMNEIVRYQESLIGKEFTIESCKKIKNENYFVYKLKEDHKNLEWNEFLLEK
ncbi:hypothetical protein QB607_003255 [Clostridium botulinum]|nr:hypothetical protein [Clostridium botulinum]EKS4395927.1 hypothetical protein [Clostridium botulinum]